MNYVNRGYFYVTHEGWFVGDDMAVANDYYHTPPRKLPANWVVITCG